MSWVPPIPLQILAGVFALALAVPRVGRPTGNLWLAAKTFAAGIVACGGFAAAWALY